MQQLCDFIYLGMSFKESLILLHVKEEDLQIIAQDKKLLNLVQYARTKAKKDMLKHVQEILSGAKTSFTTYQMIKHMLSSRYGFTENRFEVNQKQRQHLDHMKHKHALMKQWADFQAAKLVNEATHDQLEGFQK